MCAGDIRGLGPGHLDDTLELIRQLQVDRHRRDRLGAYYVEGYRNIIRAFDHRRTFLKIVVSRRLLGASLVQKQMRRLKRSVPSLTVSPEAFRSVSRTERASGVGAILRQHWTSLDRSSGREGLCWLAMESTRSPGNLGTLLRTCQAVGAAGVILLGPQVDPFHPAVVRGSMGAVFALRCVRASHEAFGRWVRRRGVQVVGAAPDAEHAYDRSAYRRPIVLMLGHERHGLSAAQNRLCRMRVSIPMMPGCDSLNLGVAGSLLLYEVHRAVGAESR